MIYTQFGNTGVQVSRLGFGCMRLPQKLAGGKPQVDEDEAVAMMHKALELGINYFDSAYFYHGGMSERILGKAMKGRRDRALISTKSPGHLVKKPGDYRRILEEQLSRLDMDSIDFYHFHGVSHEGFTETDGRSGWREDALKAKEEGLIKHISFSFHSKEPEDMRRLVDMGLFESVLCQYNVLDQSNARGMEYARGKGLGVAVMGPLGGGRVSGLPAEVAEKLGIRAAASAELGLRFVASNPSVDILLSGMSSMRQLLDNAEYVSRIEPLSEKELAGIRAMMEENKRLADLYCTGCGYCMPCPQGVNIPHIFRMMSYHRVYGVTEYARSGYAEIGSPWVPGKRADACTQCGACETKCPQKLNIRGQLKESRKALD